VDSTGQFVVVLAQTAASWAMAGFITTLQVLNYPLLALIDPAGVPRYETAHNRRFAVVLAPGLLVAAGTTVALFFLRSPRLSWWAPLTMAILLLIIVAVTARYGAPAHTRLAQSFDPVVHAQLVRTNWIRVLAWTALGLLDLVLLYRLAHP
jgi:hypothetical protein